MTFYFFQGMDKWCLKPQFETIQQWRWCLLNCWSDDCELYFCCRSCKRNIPKWIFYVGQEYNKIFNKCFFKYQLYRFKEAPTKHEPLDRFWPWSHAVREAISIWNTQNKKVWSLVDSCLLIFSGFNINHQDISIFKLLASKTCNYTRNECL